MTKSDLLTLHEFRSRHKACFMPGTWVIEYHDRTHLPNDTFVSLGIMEIQECTPEGEAFFWFRPRSRKSLEDGSKEKQDALSLEEIWKSEEAQKGKKKKEKESQSQEEIVKAAKQLRQRAARLIHDQLAESLIRLGMLKPVFEIQSPESLDEQRFATIILDTNTLRDGTLRHLKEQFPHLQLWAIIPIVSLMEIGERVANMTSQARSDWKSAAVSLLRVRPQATIIPQEVQWIKENYPTETLELAPELLRAFRGYEQGKGDTREPDRVSINDRLILEGIKDLCRQRGISKGVYLASGDKDMSRLASLEGIRTIYPCRPVLNDYPDGIFSARYSLKTGSYFYCSIHSLLWDLAHVFSKVRARCLDGGQEGDRLDVFYYYPTKLVKAWIDDKMEVTAFGPGSIA